MSEKDLKQEQDKEIGQDKVKDELDSADLEKASGGIWPEDLWPHNPDAL
jgi:hypothetical protein